MKLEVVEEGIKDIPVKELQLNQIAVITSWGSDGHPYNGKIITLVNIINGSALLVNPLLVSIGESEVYWDDWEKLSERFRVRVLSPGTILKIV